MIRVLSVTIYGAQRSEKLYYDSPKERYFESNRLLQYWVENLECEYEKIFRQPVKAYVIRRSKPKDQIDMTSVIMNTAKVMGKNPEDVVSKIRKREFVDVKKIACMILLDADYSPLDIEANTPFKHRAVYYYRTKMENRIETEKGFEEVYKDIREKVLKLMNHKDDK